MNRTKLLALAALLAAMFAVLAPAGAGAQDTKDLGTETKSGGGQSWNPADEYVSNDGPDKCLGHRVTMRAEPGVATIGTPGQDVIAGTDGPDLIYGMSGYDIICGFDGNDIIYGDAANERHEGTDFINAGRGNDTVYGGPLGDEIHGSSGNDTIYGDLKDSNIGSSDVIMGGNDNDHIIGGPGDDSIWGDRSSGWGGPEEGFGHDYIDLVSNNGGKADIVTAGAGNDTIIADDGNEQTVWAGSGNDTCKIDEKDIHTNCENF